VEFEDIRVSFEDWQEMKPKTPFGQLPTLEVDGKVFAQSNAILNYAGTAGTGKAYPTDPIKRLEIDQWVGFVGDITKTFSPAGYLARAAQSYGHPEGWEKTEECAAKVKELREKFVAEKLPEFAAKITAALEKTGEKFICTEDFPTIADTLLLQRLRQFTLGHIDHISKDCLEAFPKVAAYVKRMESLPQFEKYYAERAAAKAAKASA